MKSSTFPDLQRTPVDLLAASLVRTHRLLPPGTPRDSYWCYTSVLTGGRWLRHRSTAGDPRCGIMLRADRLLPQARAELLVRTALNDGDLEVWVALDCGQHGWWEFAPLSHGLPFAGTADGVATWHDPSGCRPPERLVLDGQALRHPFNERDSRARRLAEGPASPRSRPPRMVSSPPAAQAELAALRMTPATVLVVDVLKSVPAGCPAADLLDRTGLTTGVRACLRRLVGAGWVEQTGAPRAAGGSRTTVYRLTAFGVEAAGRLQGSV